MRAWKVLAILAIVAGGFGAGYLWHRVNAPAPVVQTVPPPTTVAANNEPADPLLILPPPDAKGVMLEPAHLMVTEHFREAAGLEPTKSNPIMSGNGLQSEPRTQVVEHRVQPSPGSDEPERPLVRFRLNVEFDVNLPKPTQRMPQLQPIYWNLPENGPMPRERREPSSGVTEELEELPMPRESTSADVGNLFLPEMFNDGLERRDSRRRRLPSVDVPTPVWEVKGVAWFDWIRSLADKELRPEHDTPSDREKSLAAKIAFLMEAVGPPRDWVPDRWLGTGYFGLVR